MILYSVGFKTWTWAQNKLSRDECLLGRAAIKVATVRINEVVTISHIRVCCK